MGKDLKGRELGKGICQRKDGRYYARVTYKTVKIELYGNNYQALAKEVRTEKERIDAGIICLEQYTVSEWFDEWFETYKMPRIKPQSATPMKGKVYSTFMPIIGNMKLNELRSIDLQRACNELLKEGKYANKSISEALGRLRECFASAVNNRYMAVNPAFDLVVPFPEQRIKDSRWLKPEEIQIFLSSAKDNWWYEMLYVMIHTGLRIGEVGGLKKEDIHWSENGKNGYIEVNQALVAQYENGVKTLRFGDLKTYNSHRRIPFLKDVESQLQVQINKVEKLKQSLGGRYRAKGEFVDLVFVTSMGSPCTRYNAEHTINSLVKQINLSEAYAANKVGREPVYMEDLYPHALRHTFASLCYRAKIDPKVTQALMGHANYSTTINIYTHLSEQDMQYDLNKFNAMNFSEVPEIEMERITL